jgi:hypothetical protein
MTLKECGIFIYLIVQVVLKQKRLMFIKLTLVRNKFSNKFFSIKDTPFLK